MIYPIDDETDMFWSINDDEVKFAETIEKYNSNGKYYSNEIYEQRFYEKWVYEGKELTLIFFDTHTDGMKYFVFLTILNVLLERRDK